MTLYQLAKLLPEKYRRQMLDGNVIYKAIAKAGDAHMTMLVIYWNNYIDAGGTPVDDTCNICLNNILTKFKALLPHFVQLEKESQLLEL